MKDGAKNRLREQDIRRIVDTWREQKEIPHYSRLAKWDEIARNDFNLNIPRYVAAKDAGVKHNLDGHLRGGISNEEIEAVINHIKQNAQAGCLQHRNSIVTH